MDAREWSPKNVLVIAAGVIVSVVIVPLLLIARAAMWVFGVDDRADRTPEEVADYLRKLIDGTEEEWDLDDFESVPIKNEQLDSVRCEFVSIHLPMDEVGRAKAQELLSRVEGMSRNEQDATARQPRC